MPYIPFDGELETGGYIPFDGELEAELTDEEKEIKAATTRRLASYGAPVRRQGVTDDAANAARRDFAAADPRRVKPASVAVLDRAEPLDPEVAAFNEDKAAFAYQFNGLSPGKRRIELEEWAGQPGPGGRFARELLAEERSLDISGRLVPMLGGVPRQPPVGGGGGSMPPKRPRFLDMTRNPLEDEGELTDAEVLAKRTRSRDALELKNLPVNIDASYEYEIERAKKLAKESPLQAAAAAGFERLKNFDEVGGAIAELLSSRPGYKGPGASPEAKRRVALADALTPDVAKMDIEDAWKGGKFGEWLTTNLVMNAPQYAQNLTALFFPPARALLLPGMSAQSAGESFASGDSAGVALLKGGAEGVGEFASFKVFDKIYATLRSVPNPIRGKFLATVAEPLSKALSATGAQAISGGVEEGVTQVLQNAADIYVAGKDKGLSDGALGAMVIGLFSEGAMMVPGAGAKLIPQSASRQFHDAFTADAADRHFDKRSTEAFAAASLSPETFDPNVVRPEHQARSFGGGVERAGPPKRQSILDKMGIPPVAGDDLGPSVEGGITPVATQPPVTTPIEPAAPIAADSFGDDVTPLMAEIEGLEARKRAEGSTASAIWTGRNAGGYETQEAAVKALESGRPDRSNPGLDWSLEQLPSGRWQLAGRPKETQAKPTATILGRPVTEYEPELLETISVSKASSDGVRALAKSELERRLNLETPTAEEAGIGIKRTQARTREDQVLVDRLKNLMGGGLQRRGGGVRHNPTLPESLSPEQEIATGVIESLFGIRTVVVGDIPVSGVADPSTGVTYINSKLSSGKAILFNAFHEAAHSTSSTNPKIWGAYTSGIEGYFKPGAHEERQADENKRLLVGETPVSLEYAAEENRADVVGAMSYRESMWRKMIEIDTDGFRRLRYRFMANAAKVLDKLPSSKRMKMALEIVTDVDAVESLTAKMWVEKANAPMVPKNKTEASAQRAWRAAKSRLSFSRPTSIDDIDDLGAFNIDRANADLDKDKPVDDSDYDLESLAEELALETGRPVRIGSRSVVKQPTDYDAVSKGAITSAGVMAEDAFPDLDYTDAQTGGQVASVRIKGKSYTAKLYAQDFDSGGKPNSRPTVYAQNPTEGKGVAQHNISLSDKASRAWNKRTMAAAVLHSSGHDIAKSIPKEARDRVLNLWKGVSKLPLAFEFNKAAKPHGKNYAEVAQNIANDMLAGTKFKVEALPDSSFRTNYSQRGVALTIYDGKSSETGYIEIKREKGEQLAIFHAEDFEKGSAFGKPFYQVALALSNAIDARNESHDMLLAVNTHRRTEQMMSAAMRLGRTTSLDPGVGQRVYGWERKKTPEAQDANLVRLAVASARNVAEFAPEIVDLVYDIEAGKFKDIRGNDAEDQVDDILNDPDVRAVSISRSTMARAALTFQAIREDVALPEKIGKPLLYSKDEASEAPEDEPKEPKKPKPLNPKTIEPARLAGIKVSYEIKVEDTGRMATITIDASEAVRDLDSRIDRMRRLVECL